ncbi:hypothetical protein DTO027B5_2497 [Paecilomyces variotii]|nr:hypothetical protein DTO032I3_7381 [Paecilomyces variotii]KAJ9281191.1 hypothetical protein DTO021D3_1850 [Paecilomyces variotii]KAJ9324814.1 hypothetical protein DTO027B3_4276 [Paecilomyces variotii]KAJ9335634.1 hypothetical protein DTO027B5_2497 [Paecilomyces variotii]KAJ9344855.1 hypothetical protein DTO027B6_2561 [Paecilomyces variotii]
MAAVFDDNHEPPLLHDQVYVRLTRRPGSTGYTILQSSKFSPVMKGPFNIKRRVGRLTYELDLPDDWDIHPQKGNWYGINADQFDSNGDNDEVQWPKLAKPITTPGWIIPNYRRPGFLILLSDDAYCEVFERLASRGTANQLALPSVAQFHQECKKYGPQVKQLLLHVLYWFDPSWRMPRTSAKDLENFQFPAKIKQCVTSKKVRVNIENPSPESDICASSDENKEETASKNCLQELASTVLTQELGVLHDSFYLTPRDDAKAKDSANTDRLNRPDDQDADRHLNWFPEMPISAESASLGKTIQGKVGWWPNGDILAVSSTTVGRKKAVLAQEIGDAGSGDVSFRTGKIRKPGALRSTALR